MADLFNSDSDSDIEPASAEARGAVLDRLRRQADETFARGPVVARRPSSSTGAASAARSPR